MFPFKFHDLFYLSDRNLEMTLLLVFFFPLIQLDVYELNIHM